MFVNDSMPTKPFKSTAIDIKEFNGGYSFQEKPLTSLAKDEDTPISSIVRGTPSFMNFVLSKLIA
jgi:hypothetical protein